MLNALKDKAKAKAMAKFEETVKPQIDEKLGVFSQLKPADVADDDKYQAVVVKPIWTSITAASGGVVSALSKFVDIENKFAKAFFHIRDELIQVEGESVKLDPEFKDKVVPTLISSLQQ